MLSSTYGLYSSVDPAAIPQFAPAYAQELLAAHGDEWVVVDVRSAQDYGRAHLPGAASLCYASLVVALESQRPALETLAASGRGILTYANTGGSEGQSTSRDLMAMSALVEVAGVHPARLARLEGGLDAWRAAGLPLTAAEPPPRPPLAALEVVRTRAKGAIVRECAALDSAKLRVLPGRADVAVVERAADRARLLAGGWVSAKCLVGAVD